MSHPNMIHPDTELRFINEQMGHGVFATRDIPRGTITWVRDALDQVFAPNEVAALAEPYQRILRKYAYTNRHRQIVLCWDHARFVNHSCDAACLMSGYDVEIAVHDLHAGEELTDDYGILNLRNTFACTCGSPRCRQVLTPDDGLVLAGRWDALLQEGFLRISTVSQPLWWLVENPKEILAASRGVSPMKSCGDQRTQS